MASDNQQPIYPAPGHFAYFVHVTWPDGSETEVHGLNNEAEAHARIVTEGRRWPEWAPRCRNREAVERACTALEEADCDLLQARLRLDETKLVRNVAASWRSTCASQ
jgi:hypothetical protein